MLKKKTILLVLAFAANCAMATQANVGNGRGSNAASHIVLPTDDDDYSKFVAQLVAGNQSVDFRALRFAYLKSAARKRGGLNAGAELQADLSAAVKAGNDQRVREIAEKLLSVNYTNMYGHKFLRQACEHLQDDACAKQENFIEFGLIKSIITTGDGKTCATGWEVVSVAEEYFIMAMMGTTPKQQALVSGPPSCDLLTVGGPDGKNADLYFRIDAVLEDERSLFEGDKQ